MRFVAGVAVILMRVVIMAWHRFLLIELMFVSTKNVVGENSSLQQFSTHQQSM